jgi:hypothetical protein
MAIDSPQRATQGLKVLLHKEMMEGASTRARQFRFRTGDKTF